MPTPGGFRAATPRRCCQCSRASTYCGTGTMHESQSRQRHRTATYRGLSPFVVCAGQTSRQLDVFNRAFTGRTGRQLGEVNASVRIGLAVRLIDIHLVGTDGPGATSLHEPFLTVRVRVPTHVYGLLWCACTAITLACGLFHLPAVSPSTLCVSKHRRLVDGVFENRY